ncbi:PLC-like phosphodiesterase [Kickxella alabastrina]|uniref:PLC-like phosphodiesterase n=1 Tax=Kickxella alabastrina TaxID=61397 RepID=UPI0022201F76|nr:PLC-like phosphodiesterase [Kickxella alabastrina]KAI7833603.1 PLC-like phosphodiesterase [Kickxella alabastrina]
MRIWSPISSTASLVVAATTASTSSTPLGSASPAPKWNTLSGKTTRLIGHRGEKAFMPEHSLGSYWQAALEGADYIEPDLGLTKDGHLIVNHNEYLGGTTNIAHIPELAHLKSNKTWVYDVDGREKTVYNEWFVADLTLEQIRMLRINQASEYTWRPQHFNGYFGILTFEEYLQVVRNVTIELGRPFGVIPELKSPTLYNRGRPYDRYFEDRAILTLEHYGWANITRWINRDQHIDLRLSAKLRPLGAAVLGPSVWQSFDMDSARYLAQHTDVPVVALVEQLPWAFTPAGLDRLAGFAKILSTWKDIFVAGPEAYLRHYNITWDEKDIEQMGGFIAPKDLVREAHSRGIELSPYTFYDSRQDMAYICQDDNAESKSEFCPKSKAEELFYFFDMGVDYMFVENIVEASTLRLQYDNQLAQAA